MVLSVRSANPDFWSYATTICKTIRQHCNVNSETRRPVIVRIRVFVNWTITTYKTCKVGSTSKIVFFFFIFIQIIYLNLNRFSHTFAVRTLNVHGRQNQRYYLFIYIILFWPVRILANLHIQQNILLSFNASFYLFFHHAVLSAN